MASLRETCECPVWHLAPDGKQGERCKARWTEQVWDTTTDGPDGYWHLCRDCAEGKCHGGEHEPDR